MNEGMNEWMKGRPEYIEPKNSIADRPQLDGTPSARELHILKLNFYNSENLTGEKIVPDFGSRGNSAKNRSECPDNRGGPEDWR